MLVDPPLDLFPPAARPPALDPDVPFGAPPVVAEAPPEVSVDPPSLVAVEKWSPQATAKPANKSQVPLNMTGGA
jgi:hypothetical protein